MTSRNTPAQWSGIPWQQRLPGPHWEIYQDVLQRLIERGLAFVVGGGLAYVHFARRWRHTNDLDLFLRPVDRETAIEIVTAAGFNDYYDLLPYDRGWIWRGYRDGVIVDLIWEMANHHAQVDDQWMTRGPTVTQHGIELRILPIEEFIWTKLYIVQRDRCDWPDLLTVLYNEGATLDWDHLLHRVGSDLRLLSGLLATFDWLCPERAAQFPPTIWARLGLEPPQEDYSCATDRSRVARLDSRDWFYPESLPLMES